MQKAGVFIAMSCACASAACGTEVALAVDVAPTAPPTPTGDAGPGGLPEKPPVCTSAKLVDRLLYGKITLPEAVRYKRSAYYFGFPQDDRIALSVSNNNGGQVAWVTSGGSLVHVTQIVPSDFSRTVNDVRVGDDTIIEGADVGGFAAFDDGFALLTRRADPGDVIPESDGLATFLVRYQFGRGERFALPLTGTKFATNTTDLSEKHDFPAPVSPMSSSGRLVFDGSRFGAYFGVRGGTGDRNYDQNFDKFVVVDSAGQFISGFRSACLQNLGVRLLADTSGFIPFCMSDGTSGTAGAGAYAVTPTKTLRLAPEISSSSGGYAGGSIGSAVKLPNGYMIVEATRGVKLQFGQIIGPGRDFHAPAVAMLKKDLTIGYERVWPFTPTDPSYVLLDDAVNVHAQAYGDKVLLVWETIASPTFHSNTGYSTGNYGGTHFRLIDANGNAASDEEVVPSSMAPNGPDDIVQFPGGDVGWAYVPEDRAFQTVATPSVSALSEIRFVRLQYCSP